MQEVLTFKNNILKNMVIAGVSISAGLFFVAGWLLACSFFAGCAINVFNFWALSREMINCGSRGPKRKLVGLFFMRYVILVMMFSAAILMHLNIFACAGGFFLMQVLIAYYGVSLTAKRK